MAIWNVWLNNAIVHQPVTTTSNVIGATLALALDSAGSLEADVPVSHPLYPTIASLPLLGRDVWRVERDGTEVFRGRLLSRERMPLDGSVHVVVEGELAMLNDSLCLPYSFSGSPTEYVQQLVRGHNAQVDEWKRFSVGRVTVVDKGGNDYIVRGSESTATTWEELAAKTVGSSDAGHIVLRRGTRVIDWLASVAAPCDQVVKMGWNLLNLSDEADGSELVTAIHAVGADQDGTRLEIATSRTGGAGVTVRGGMLVNDALAATNGIVVREVVWDDVTTEAALWSRALAYCQQLSLPRSVTVKAIDMSDAGYAVDAFDVGQVVDLDALDTQGRMQVTGIEWDLLDPAGGSITFGKAQVTSSARNATTSQTAQAAYYVAGNSSGGGGGGTTYTLSGDGATVTLSGSDGSTSDTTITASAIGAQAALAVETGTLTKGSAASSLGTNSCRRYGKVVVVSVNGLTLASALSSGSTSGTLATIPSGYRPHAAIRAPFGSSGNHVGYVNVTTGGAITLRNSGSGSIATSASLSFQLVFVIA